MKELTHTEIHHIHGGDIGLAFATVVLGGAVGAGVGTGLTVAFPGVICLMLNHTIEDCGYALQSDPKNEVFGSFFMACGGVLGAGIGIAAVGSVFSLLK